MEDDDELYDPPWQDDLWMMPTEPAKRAERIVEPSPFTQAAGRKRRRAKIRSTRLVTPVEADWLIDQIRANQIAKTDALVEAGKLEPWNPGEYMRNQQRQAIADGRPLSSTELRAVTRTEYAKWLQENSRGRLTRPMRDRTTIRRLELISTPEDRQC